MIGIAERPPMMADMATRVASPIVIGRDRERRVLAEAIERAAGGLATTVLVGGEAGIGKSRLLREAIEVARNAEHIVLQGACISLGDDEGLPFAPIAEALRNLRRDVGPSVVDELMDPATSELASLVPELGWEGVPIQPGYRPDWAQTRVFEGLLTLLGRLGERAPVALVIEDLHWADRSTRDVIAFLTRNLSTERVALLTSFRSDELHRRHPLRPWLAEMERTDGVIRLDLERLSEADIARQIEAITGRVPDRALRDVIARRSAGNPFFAEELLAAGVTGPDDQLPDSLRELLLVRIHTLSDPTQEVLACAAVAGQSFDHDLLAHPCDCDERTIADALREAMSAQLVVADETNGALTFRHALLQEAVYDDVLPRDRRRYHARFAEALADRPVADGAAGASQLAALAHHATVAHDLPLALDGWIRAARANARVYALAEAATAYGRALELWDAVPEGDHPPGIELIDLLYEASYAAIGIGDIKRAVEVASLAVARAPGEEDLEKAVLVRERHARTLWLDGQLTASRQVLEETVALTRGRPVTEAAARATGALAGTLVLRDHNRRAVELGNEALAMARSIGSIQVEAYSMCSIGTALVNQGDCETGLPMLREALRMAHEHHVSSIDFHRSYANLSSSLEACGQVEEAASVALEGIDWAKKRGLWRMQGAFLEGNAASSLMELGRWDEARQLLEQRERPAAEGVARLNQALVSIPLGIRTGRLDDARAALRLAQHGARNLEDAQLTGPIHAAAIELAVAEGRPRDARAIAAEAFERMGDAEEVGTRYGVEILYRVIQADALALAEARSARDSDLEVELIEDSTDRIEHARRLAAGRTGPPRGLGGMVRGYMAMSEAEYAGIVGDEDPEAWARAAAIWADLGRPWPLAQCRVREAEAILAMRRSRVEAAVPLAEALRIARELGATPLIEWCESLARMGRLEIVVAGASADDEPPSTDGVAAYGLTPRELDVLKLLVAGYSNRQIGETMFISESTAGVHVSNILGKLGVSGRVEAAAAAVRAGLAD
jgi:DNA-binding CsgD family transcriptional regulator/tetratricopeptide (TPR) repeat protein